VLFLKKLGYNVDPHVMDLEMFRENLVPGSFLSGLALGYEIVYDRIGVEKLILEFLEKLAKTKYVLHNEYGSWELSRHAYILLKRKREHGKT